MKNNRLISSLQKRVADHERRILILEGAKRFGGEENKGVTSKLDLDFDMNPRAFLKLHSNILKLSGPRKFVLIVAYLVKGDESIVKTMNEINTLWDRVRGIMGGELKSMYVTRARESDWIDSPKAGTYQLRPRWREIFE